MSQADLVECRASPGLFVRQDPKERATLVCVMCGTLISRHERGAVQARIPPEVSATLRLASTLQGRRDALLALAEANSGMGGYWTWLYLRAKQMQTQDDTWWNDFTSDVG